MLKHVVMYKLKDNSEQQKQALIDKFLSMKGKIDVLLDIESGGDVLGTPRSFDVTLICVFKDVDALNTYAVHPVHIPVKEYVHSVIEKAHSVDFIY